MHFIEVDCYLILVILEYIFLIVSYGSDGGRLNPLQINKADDTDAGSYDMNITKMANIYSFLAPEASDIERRMFAFLHSAFPL